MKLSLQRSVASNSSRLNWGGCVRGGSQCSIFLVVPFPFRFPSPMTRMTGVPVHLGFQGLARA